MSQTFATLKTAVADYLNRTDISTAQVGNFINLAMRNLEDGQITIDTRIQSHNWNCMEVRQTTTPATVSTFLTFPSRVKDVLWLKILEDSIYYDLSPVAPAVAYGLYPNGSDVTTRPELFSLIEAQGEILLRPYPDKAYLYDICYYAYHADLSADSDHNWWTDNHWDCLLYGALLQATPYLNADARITIWQNFYDRAVALLYRQEKQKNTSGGMLRIKSYMPRQLTGGGSFDIDVIE
jgi:hypothetical protein